MKTLLLISLLSFGLLAACASNTPPPAHDPHWKCDASGNSTAIRCLSKKDSIPGREPGSLY